jgi:hypothetical protein
VKFVAKLFTFVLHQKNKSCENSLTNYFVKKVFKKTIVCFIGVMQLQGNAAPSKTNQCCESTASNAPKID